MTTKQANQRLLPIFLLVTFLLGLFLGHLLFPIELKPEFVSGQQRNVESFTYEDETYVFVSYYSAHITYYRIGKLIQNGTIEWIVGGGDV